MGNQNEDMNDKLKTQRDNLTARDNEIAELKDKITQRAA